MAGASRTGCAGDALSQTAFGGRAAARGNRACVLRRAQGTDGRRADWQSGWRDRRRNRRPHVRIESGTRNDTVAGDARRHACIALQPQSVAGRRQAGRRREPWGPPMNTLRLALVMLRRDWRAGELSVLFAAVVLAVASVGTVGFFTDRVKGALTRQANVLLGADLLLSGDRPLPDDFVREARARGLDVVPVIRFNSMVQAAERAAGGDPVLADVKAVGAGYPLRGAITLADAADPAGRTANGIPASGQVWIETRLAARLDVHEGARLAVGETTLVVAAIV